MLINTNSTGFKMARGVVSLAAGIGASALAKDALNKLGYQPTHKYQVVTTAIAVFAIGGMVSSAVNKSTKESINELAEAINTIADGKISVTDTLKA